MRRTLLTGVAMALALALGTGAPVWADDTADLKAQVEQIGVAYAEAFNKHDAAGLSALYTADGLLVNVLGARKTTPDIFEGMFKSGLDHLDAKIDQVIPLSQNAAIGTGTFHQTGKTATGTPIDVDGIWSAAYVKEGDKWKLRMLTGFAKPAPAK